MKKQNEKNGWLCIQPLLFAGLFLISSCNDEALDQKNEAVIPAGIPKTDNDTSQWVIYNEFENWPTFKCPPLFRKLPYSDLEGRKWLVTFEHSESKFSIEASPYGWVSEFDEVQLGIPSARDAFLITNLKGGVSYKKRDGYEVFRQSGDGKTIFYYLRENPTWGNCFDTLSFFYPENLRDGCEGLILKIESTFIPSFMKTLSTH